ncbi:hypothetical protein CSB37_03260 [bacterium DOLZORAL124_38_8]|nr:MAG: hypothetical protein CSB37_03260 [bacterium DOLZORAL124_38_8]
MNAQDPQNTQTNTQMGDANQAQTGAATSGFHFVIPPHPNTVFNDAEFLALLEGSISLSMEEKKRVIEAIPRLGQEQIDELIKIFNEEKVKFAELEEQYGDEVAKLKKQRENEFELAKKQEENKAAEEEAAAAEAAEAEALRKKLLGQ